MKRNFDIVITDFDGAPIKDGPDRVKRLADGSIVYDEKTSLPVITEKAPPITLKSLSFMAMRATLERDDQMKADDKLKMYALGHKISKGGIVEITVEELATLRERIGRTFDYITVGSAIAILDADLPTE